MSQGDVGFAVMLVIVGEPQPRTKPMGCCLFILLYSFLRRGDIGPLPKGWFIFIFNLTILKRLITKSDTVSCVWLLLTFYFDWLTYRSSQSVANTQWIVLPPSTMSPGSPYITTKVRLSQCKTLLALTRLPTSRLYNLVRGCVKS